MSVKFNAVLSVAAAALLLLTAGTFPASANPPQSPSEPSASTPAPGAAVATPGPVGKQVLVAQGDGRSLYADAASAGSIQISQVRVAGSATPMTVVNCGIVTCSVYLSRSQTRAANYDIALYGGGLAALAAACSPIAAMTGPAAGFVEFACLADIAIEGAFLYTAITHAAGDNGCLRIRYSAAGGLAAAFYDDHSTYCHNS